MIYSFRKYLLSNYYVFGTIAGNRNAIETNKIHKSLPHRVYLLVEQSNRRKIIKASIMVHSEVIKINHYKAENGKLKHNKEWLRS